MKIGVYVIQNINPSAGGNFSYYEKLVAAIDSYDFDKRLEICFVGRVPKENVKLKSEYIRLQPNFFYKLFRLLEKINVVKLFSRILSTNANICNRFDLAALKKNHVDVLLYPKQFFREVDNFPFMTMNWDAGHKSTYMFPEFDEGFEFREHWYRLEMQKALAIIVESEGSKKEFSDFFGITESKIAIVPLFPGGVVDLQVSGDIQMDALKKFKLENVPYFFYPAQFWAHKNHYNLILGFKKLIERNSGRNIKLVFTGSDKGNKRYIKSTIKGLGLENDILIFGFVSNEEVYTFYKNAVALVMPTFLGPTNMPVLEAQSLRTAVICSDLSGHRETCQDGSLYADPSDPDQWHAAMERVLDERQREELLSRAEVVLEKSKFNIRDAVKSLEEIFIKFIPIRRTFN